MEYLLQASSFASGELPELTRVLWHLADRKLRWIQQREAVTQIDLPFRRLSDSFNLSQVEQDVLMLVAAPKVDPRYEQHFEQIDREIVEPTVRTAIALLSRSFDESVSMRRVFSLDAKLLAHSLLLAEVHGHGEGDFLNVGLEVPRRVIGEMLGESHVSEELVALSRLRTAKIALDQVVLPKDIKETAVSLVRNHAEFVRKRQQWGLDDVISYGRGLIMLFSGPPGTGKTMLAHAVAANMGKRLFCIDLPKLAEARGSFESNLDAVFREARLLDAVLFFDECEQIFLSRRKGNDAMPVLLTRLEQYDGVAILATNMEETLDEALARRVVAKIDFRAPTSSARAEIWRKHLPQALPLADDVDIDQLAEGFDLTGGTIKNAVLTAVVGCVSRGDDHVRMADLQRGARLQVRVPSDEVERVERPESRLDDVVLPRELHERIDRFVTAARARTTILAEWGLSKTLGSVSAMTALFSGSSGTGKSMTAEAIASALDRPIIRCPLASVMSKWVGETARNVESLFRAAKEHRAVLVFDEADALFAPRVSVKTANDRFANAETGALLGQIERHAGVVILTTNLVNEIDPAFERRLQLRLAFPFPDARARTSLWKRMLGSDTPLATDVNLLHLGRAFELSGGLIRNAVFAAALEAAAMPVGARVITQAMLERAASEQLGRPVSLVAAGNVGWA
jgi:SpoVK/Ycf46/Vps4 family AAA+-type ATPase